MKVTFTTPDTTVHVLCDDTASPPIRGRLKQHPAKGVVQSESLYLQASEFVAGRGNTGIVFGLVAEASYANYAAVQTAIAAAVLLTGQSGTLIWYYDPTLTNYSTYAGCACESADAVPFAGEDVVTGVNAAIAYSFKCPTMVNT